tara:strand:- start:1553 stop:2671 length:1119 start_codon:yes stop_codon:yes gene_type:complete
MSDIDIKPHSLRRIAFISPSGLWVGGVEKYTQQIAMEYSKAGHSVDYFYTESTLYLPKNIVHPGLDLSRKELVESAGVRTIKVDCGSVDSLESGGTWNNTNLFEVFDPSHYDFVVGSHKGEPSWPFSIIKGPKIIEFVHGTDFTSGASTYADLYVLINEYQTTKWFEMGGIHSKTQVITPMVEIDPPSINNNCSRWGIPEDKFIFGLHQSARAGLNSGIPLEAYSKIENENNFFVILGGGDEYKEQAEELGLKNFLQLPPVSTSKEINSFLSCLDVYAHGHKDGEVCSSAIIEAMANSLPMISHVSPYNNGHVAQLSNCGIVVNHMLEYAYGMLLYEKDVGLIDEAIKATKLKYKNDCDINVCRNKLLELLA